MSQPLQCPFCGAVAMARWDGPDTKPFSVCCSDQTCLAHRPSVTFAEADDAMAAWNRRVQLPPAKLQPLVVLCGFMKCDTIRGELVTFELDRTGVMVSDKIAFSPSSRPLALRDV